MATKSTLVRRTEINKDWTHLDVEITFMEMSKKGTL